MCESQPITHHQHFHICIYISLSDHHKAKRHTYGYCQQLNYTNMFRVERRRLMMVSLRTNNFIFIYIYPLESIIVFLWSSSPTCWSLESHVILPACEMVRARETVGKGLYAWFTKGSNLYKTLNSSLSCIATKIYA